MSWSVNKDVSVERDGNGRVRVVRHIGQPFTGGPSPYGLAADYLEAVRDLIGITDEQIDFLRTSASAAAKDGRGDGLASTRPGPQLRWVLRTEQRSETIVLLIQQTFDAVISGEQVDVEGSGLRVLVHTTPTPHTQRIGGLSSTLRESFLRAAPPRQRAFGDRPVPRMATIRLARVNRILAQSGFAPFPDIAELIDVQFPARLLVFRYAPSEPGVPGRPTSELTAGLHDAPLPGTDYVALAVRLIPQAPTMAPAAARGRRAAGRGVSLHAVELIVRDSDDAPLAVRPLITHAQPVAAGQGLAFKVDPITRTGDFKLGPEAQQAALDGFQQTVTLPDLLVPALPADPWRLSGLHAVVDGNDPATPIPCAGLDIAPPQAATKEGFKFASRTNDFAAVNAYFHCASMFIRLDGYNLPFGSFPMRYELPARIVHRAAIQPGPCGDGRCVDAQMMILPGVGGGEATDPTCGFAPTPQSRVQFRFALADLTHNPGTPGFPLSPLGIACDVRIVWHEFCHALIAGSTDQPEFPFAHSAGDALAAIMCDPGSKLAEGVLGQDFRGLTYPWVSGPNRRHDRNARDGWSWSGPMGTVTHYTTDIRDRDGYAREQVLSSTLFRFYRAIGGDAKTGGGGPAIPLRQAAADYAVYLVVRAIGSLGPAATVPVVDAGAFAAALMDADAGTQRLDTPEQAVTALAGQPPGRVGGAAHKVIRWAFERQGLYADLAHPRADGAGEPMPIDLYLEDKARRLGRYRFVADWQAAEDAVWNRHHPDGGAAHELPQVAVPNYIYVAVNNRGPVTAADITVAVHVAKAVTDLAWPGAGWSQLALAPGGVNGAGTSVSNLGPVLFGPFEWTPAAPGDYAVLVSVDAEGDRSNINLATMLPCAFLPSRLAQLVPFDNNLGLAAWTV